MAKRATRHANDRNEKAVQAARNEALNLDTHVLEDGTVILLKDFDPLFLQTVMGSVTYPAKPTYEVTLASGRKEYYPMDEKVVEQSPELKDIWDKYIMETAQANAEEMNIMTRAILLDATELPEDWSDPSWQRRMRLVGAKLPEDPDEFRIFYLSSKMKVPDVIALTGKVMRRTGVPEEFISAAEDSFPGEVRDRRGRSGDVADADADARGDGEVEAEQVAA